VTDRDPNCDHEPPFGALAAWMPMTGQAAHIGSIWCANGPTRSCGRRSARPRRQPDGRYLRRILLVATATWVAWGLPAGSPEL